MSSDASPRVKFASLFGGLSKGSILFPGTKSYEEVVFVGNFLYRLKTPAVVVQAVDEEDVRATIQFAHQQGMQLTVRSGGHSNAAYCMNQGGIVPDMRFMNTVSVDKEDMEISIGGGAIWRDVYNQLHDQSKRLMAMGG